MAPGCASSKRHRSCRQAAAADGRRGAGGGSGAHACPAPHVMALVPQPRRGASHSRPASHKLTIPVSASEPPPPRQRAPDRKRWSTRCAPSRSCATAPPSVRRRGRHRHRPLRLHDPGRGAGRRRDPDGRAVRRGRRRRSGLSDTIGYANPAQVRRLFRRVRAEIGDKAGAAHMHNTRGLGLANCLAAYDVGVRTFDASLGGLGGCPYAPGASRQRRHRGPGVHVRGHGRRTGIDIER